MNRGAKSKEWKCRTYKKYWTRAMEDYFAHFKQRSAYLRPLMRMLTGLGVDRALDIGCADGALVDALLQEGVDACGVDVSLDAVNASPVKNRLKWVDVDEERLPFPNEYFGLVTAIDVLEHLYRPEKAIADISRVLKPGGYFFFTTPSPSPCHKIKIFGRPLFPPEPTHVSELPYHAWIRILRKCGLEPISPPKFRLFKLKLSMTLKYVLMRYSTMGPRARYLKLHKAGPVGKLIKFAWDLTWNLYSLFNCIWVLAVKRHPQAESSAHA